MKSPVIAYAGWLLLTAALGFYVYGMYLAIDLSWGTAPGDVIDPKDFPPEISTMLSTMQSLLLTNLGILLGISIARPGSALAKQLLLRCATVGTNLDIPSPPDIREKIQMAALVIYLIALIASVITWIVNHFSMLPTEVVPIIAESGKMFLGVILAYLAVLIGNRP